MQIDWWTIGLQSVNVVILVALLARFFWKPLVAVVDDRRKTIASHMAALAEQEKQMETSRAALASARAGIDAERERVLEAARQQAETERGAIISHARDEVAALDEAARKAMDREQDERRAAQQNEAVSLAVDIARHLLASTGAQPSTQTALFSGLVKAVAALPDHERESLKTGFVLASSMDLSIDERKKSEATLGNVIGITPPIRWITDTALIQGFAIRTSHLTVSSNWQADLQRIRETLTHV
ncbi:MULTISPECIES: F0F1 ATP synthase subunit B family protein [Acetobacter]|uniref:ATP synthase subunit b n=3 Tax=Acetobacter TaxID=434 RepID=A0A401WUC6_ACEPA|nr:MULTISPECIES: hypothetical protein [Acetobacter]MCP1243792.1 hypothetical protein [Acetobacter lambici]MCP1259812.1 hypothetical protein [Acetobacter lambici]NHO58022.1 hypothetical protein [Acetobacter lambici]GCD52941.1 ATP synthase F0 subunit B [Acetobacter pasteurianus NBRC 3188]